MASVKINVETTIMDKLGIPPDKLDHSIKIIIDGFSLSKDQKTKLESAIRNQVYKFCEEEIDVKEEESV